MIINNEDCKTFLPKIKDNSVDLVLIDPPYQISKDNGMIATRIKGDDTDRFRISYQFGKWDNEFEGMRDIIPELYRVLREGGTIVCFYDLWKISYLFQDLSRDDKLFKQIRFAEWIKTNPVPINSKRNYLTNAREAIITGVKGSKPTFNSEYDNGIYMYPIEHKGKRYHPTQKNIDLIVDLMKKHSNEGDTVLDCFLGSGTTAIASMMLNRKFIGCEIDENYYKASIERITEYGENNKIDFSIENI